MKTKPLHIHLHETWDVPWVFQADNTIARADIDNTWRVRVDLVDGGYNIWKIGDTTARVSVRGLSVLDSVRSARAWLERQSDIPAISEPKK